jgi:hypothetical protein
LNDLGEHILLKEKVVSGQRIAKGQVISCMRRSLIFQQLMQDITLLSDIPIAFHPEHQADLFHPDPGTLKLSK